MPARNVRYASEFVDGVAGIYSARLLDELNRRLESIEAFPGIGSSNVRPSLARRYGPGIRKFPVPPFVIVYRYDDVTDGLDFLALVHEKNVE